MKINKSKLETIRKKHNLSLIILYGSTVDGKLHLKSDVDVAVVREKDNKKLDLLEIIIDLIEALATDKVDVSDITHADPLFLFSVLRKSKLLSGNHQTYDALLRLAFHKYSDYLPFLKMEKLFVKERIKSYVSDL